MSQNIIHTAVSIRQIALHQIQAIPEELFDVQPKSFPHTIRWNVGHLVFCLEHFFALGLSFDSRLPQTYAALFHTGTKPADWTIEPPTKAELVQRLTDQLESITDISPGLLEQSLPAAIEMGPLRFETAGEVINFAVAHEAMHLGTISSLVKVIQHDLAIRVQ